MLKFKKSKESRDDKGSYVKVLGTGCSKCNVLAENAEHALNQLGMEPYVEHITDLKTIASYGVMVTPSLVIGENVVSSGEILSTEQIVDKITNLRK